MKYLTKIYWSDEDDAFVGEVPALEGCVSHGDTYLDAAKNLQEAMELWLESAKKHGDPVPDPDYAAEEIRRLEPILNLSKLAELSGINKHTLSSKLRRGTKFTPAESGRLREIFSKV